MSIRNDGFFMEAPVSAPLTGEKLNAVMRNVYGWMTMGLGVTAFVALLLSSINLQVSTIVFIIAIVAETAIVVGLSWAISRISATMAGMLFFIYAAINGLTLTVFLSAFATGSILPAAVTTAAVFGAMTIVGLTTNVDLSKYRTYFIMGIIGLFIALIVNIFLASSALEFAISVFGVLLFTGLTAYDTQKISRIASNPKLQVNSDDTFKFSILAALTLYLDFINLFVFLVMLFSGGRD